MRLFTPLLRGNYQFVLFGNLYNAANTIRHPLSLLSELFNFSWCCDFNSSPCYIFPQIRNYREDWKLSVNQPVAGNYYPVNVFLISL